MALPRFNHCSHTWLRRTLALLMLCFALSTVAHAGHSHDAKAQVDTLCGYCTTFSHAADAPVRIGVVPASQTLLGYTSTECADVRSGRIETAAQPRGPPFC